MSANVHIAHTQFPNIKVYGHIWGDEGKHERPPEADTLRRIKRCHETAPEETVHWANEKRPRNLFV